MNSNRYTVYLLLGSNLGDRQNFLHSAIRAMEASGIIVEASSAVYETAPWGVEGQGAYLNMAIQCSTCLYPFGLMRVLQGIENSLGRSTKGDMAPRVIDIDILFFEDWQIVSPDLIIPHPRLHIRKFTLVPLVDIADGYLHPTFGKTLQQLLYVCVDDSQVVNYFKVLKIAWEKH
jgi:2-amino-4-hydroxy-6-hydroxymethyldihydropteridine diphosphokinase